MLLCSFFQGLLDIFLVGLLARLVGLLAGSRLEDHLPGIKVFLAVSSIRRVGWWHAHCLLLACIWNSFCRGILQARLTAEVWADLVNKVYDNLMRQSYDFFH